MLSVTLELVVLVVVLLVLLLVVLVVLFESSLSSNERDYASQL